MAKRFKLKLSRVIPSFQICRSKLETDPIPAIYKLSSFNPKALDINYPKFPDPPPTTPTKRHAYRHPSRSLAYYLADLSIESQDFSWKNEETNNKWPARPHRRRYLQKSISFSDESNDNISPVVVAENKKLDNNDEIESDEENDELETETLIFSSRSFSYDSSFDFCYPPTVAVDKSDNIKFKQTSQNKRIRKLKRQVSKKNWKSFSPEINSPMRASVLRRMISCTADGGKVKESVAVVKKSEDPYADFKRSMLEMILEKQMFEAKDLQELLQCFLSLNSSQYHGVIVNAFAEIWEILFCDSPVKKPNSMRLSRLQA